MSSSESEESGDAQFVTSDESSNESEDSKSSAHDDEVDESIIQVRRSKSKKRAVVVTSDSEEDEDAYLEARSFSPRTRMSITGVKPDDLSDSSEIDYEDGEAVEAAAAQLSTISSEQSGSQNSAIADSFEKSFDATMKSVFETSVNNNEETIEESVSIPNKNGSIEESVSIPNKNGSIEESVSIPNKNRSIEESVSIPQDSFMDVSNSDSSYRNTNSIVLNSSEDIDSDDDIAKNQASKSTLQKIVSNENVMKTSSPFVPRYSQAFISDKLSSTLYEPRDLSRISSDDSDVRAISNRVTPIEILSSGSDTEDSKPTSSRKLVQPKITKLANVQLVSQEFYNKECKKLEQLKAELQSAERLCEKVAKNLPDGGEQLKLRVKRLMSDVEIKEKYVATLRIENINMPPVSTKSGAVNLGKENVIPNWDEISAAVNQIQPVYTGKRGMTNFINQKALTVERLKDLHGSIENCPGEDVLADDPKGLKVTLMDHQKHALAWMRWREKQKPHGGILADDMGLGKTLTMISLVLDVKNRPNDDEANDRQSDSDEDKNENKSWTTKGRRDLYQGGTLVVCPASLVNQWESEVHTKVSRNKISVCVHHGNSRAVRAKDLRSFDMVITTYAIVPREKNSALFGIKWERIILDEGHVIRNHKAKSSEAVCMLRGKYRWVLTGTPVQNKEMDLYALLKFLRCSPFDDLANWKVWIANKSAGGIQRLHTVMKSLMLRRTKIQLQERGELQCLPEKRIEFIDVELDKDEMNVYQKIMIFSRSLFAQFLMQRAERNTDLLYRADAQLPTFMQSKDPNGAYYKVYQKLSKMHHGSKEVKSHEILTLLLRLRQICCHAGLINAMLEDVDQAAIDSDSDERPEIDLLEQLNKMTLADNSGNNSDLTPADNSGNNIHLTPADQLTAKASARVLLRSNPVFDYKRPSSKIKKIMQTLVKLHVNDKAIVVSQWTSVLNIIKDHLERAGIKTASLNGTIAVKNRQAIVENFNSAGGASKVLLLSLTAGGVGLNLIGANHLLLIDLHWNPQLEAQAQDRIYRVGQKKNIVVYKFICKDTIEERIKALQEHKLAIANGVLTGTKSEGSKLTMDDIRGLFGM